MQGNSNKYIVVESLLLLHLIYLIIICACLLFQNEISFTLVWNSKASKDHTSFFAELERKIPKFN